MIPWPLFIIFWVYSRKTGQHRVPFFMPLLIPILLTTWSFYYFYTGYAMDLFSVIAWSACLAGGCWGGVVSMKKTDLKFDRKQGTVEIEGSWLPGGVVEYILLVKCGLIFMDWMFGVSAFRSDRDFFESAEFLPTLILGLFLGRGIGCALRYQQAGLRI